MSSRVFALNVHATYACRHSGACCTAGWSIPVEAHLLPLVGRTWLVPDSTGACPQFDRRSSLCRIQRDAGEAMLPVSCFQFPRRALVDQRGTLVTLSHFCPTAATLLLDSKEPLDIVENPPAFPPGRAYEGLDATGEWPPLLRPDVLFDFDSFAVWERSVVRTLDSTIGSADEGLATIASRAEQLAAWTPDRGSLREWTLQVVDSGQDGTAHPSPRYAEYAGARAYDTVRSAVPSGLSPPAVSASLGDSDAVLVAPRWDTFARLVRRYVGAKAFASWTAYQARGVRAQVAELYATAAVLRAECARACASASRPLDRALFHQAVRETDRLLMHLADRDTLAEWFRKADLR